MGPAHASQITEMVQCSTRNQGCQTCYMAETANKLSVAQINKGGKSLKKLWCCVDGRVQQVI